MMIALDSCDLNPNLYLNLSQPTNAASQESQILREVFKNEWYVAASTQTGYEAPPSITQVYIEPLSDYHYPAPSRSYTIQIRVISKVKGQPTNYNEYNEDVL